MAGDFRDAMTLHYYHQTAVGTICFSTGMFGTGLCCEILLHHGEARERRMKDEGGESLLSIVANVRIASHAVQAQYPENPRPVDQKRPSIALAVDT